jgi:hypothetical protein
MPAFAGMTIDTHKRVIPAKAGIQNFLYCIKMIRIFREGLT